MRIQGHDPSQGYIRTIPRGFAAVAMDRVSYDRLATLIR